MKFTYLGLMILVLGVLLSEPARACGDKFLVPGQLAQFDQTYAALEPGRVLLYRNPSSEVARQALTDDLVATLERVGHTVEVVAERTAFQKALTSGEFDIVLAAAEDIEGLERTGTSVLIPVVYEASWIDVVQLKETYSVVMNAPTRASQLLSVVEEALAMRRQSG